jgi:cytochrome c biogenesis protein CcmG, thiol:disulfide interchange protein DsbE
MKRAFVGLCVLLALTSCSLTEPIPIKGEVVDCANITVKPGKSEPLECLGGGTPIAADSIVGPALVNVWGTWCAPCKKELPHLAHFLQQGDGNVQVIGIAVEEKSQAAVKKFIERNGMTWPVLYDATGSTKSIFGMGVPVTWFIDAQGKVVHRKFGPFNSTEEIQLAVAKYLGTK